MAELRGDSIASEPTQYAVGCVLDGKVYLTHDEYSRQLGHANATWKCPICGGRATWDDDHYEDWQEMIEDAHYATEVGEA